MRFIARDSVRERPARTRRGLEAASAPAAVEVQAFDGHLADDRAGVGTDVDDTAPHTQHAHPAEDREQFEDGLHRVLDRRKAATLAVTVIGVDAGAYDQF